MPLPQRTFCHKEQNLKAPSQESKKVMQPQIDITLVATPFCFLNRKEDFFIYLNYRLHYQEPITIKSSGSVFDPAATFATNRIEVLDTVTKEAVYFEIIPEKSSEEKQNRIFVLKPEEGSYLFWTTSTQSARWHEYPLTYRILPQIENTPLPTTTTESRSGILDRTYP